jgi:predicted PhzF superfamily epimerase YddE/YHI9
LETVTPLHVLRVFVDADGGHGNPLGVVLDGGAVPVERRQPIATELGFSETVFVDDAERGEIRIFTPTAELPFAGHPTVGTAWLLGRERNPVDALHPPAGQTPVRYDGEITWIAARPEWAPPFEYMQLPSPAHVDSLEASPNGHGMAATWAWEDEPAGQIRSRVFPVELGVDEDEATGSAAVGLAAQLGRPIEIRQGRGSVIHANPLPNGMAEAGGRVVLDEVRELDPI